NTGTILKRMEEYHRTDIEEHRQTRFKLWEISEKISEQIGRIEKWLEIFGSEVQNERELQSLAEELSKLKFPLKKVKETGRK
ncbi:MAG: hypothetical protein Q8O55_11215, partial [Dehalococcoidales bacterium]|nr:hypothetical protein [Dehalococcoidales bacterium]